MKYLLLLLAVVVLSSYEVPTGWFKAGSTPDKYEMGTDKGAGRNNSNAATIKSNQKKIKGFGTLMQNCSPEKYMGKRIRMSGYMKAKDVRSWAGFWLRVDGEERGNSLSFDNMYDRAVKGSKDWTRYEIVLDVPEGATNVAYGALLDGTGQIWFDGLEFEIVDDSTPTTGRYKRRKLDRPKNLNFEE